MTRKVDKDYSLDKDSAVTIGKFESIHLGHQLLINEVINRAKTLNLVSLAVTFGPYPYKLFYDKSYKPLFSSKEREYIFNQYKLDYVLEYKFDSEFASTSPEGFCEILYSKLRAKVLIIGEGYRFGKDRAGTAKLLLETANEYQAEVIILPHITDEESKIGTSVIRGLLDGKKPEEAAKLLGFPFFIIGGVKQGHKLGRKLGFPTVNIEVAEDMYLPPDGVYASFTHINEIKYKSVTNIGIRPTVTDKPNTRTVESFLIGYEGDLYGATLKTDFISYIRPEIKFKDITELKNQIAKDVDRTKINLQFFI